MSGVGSPIASPWDGVFHGVYGSWNMGEQWEAFGARSERRTKEMGPARHFVTNILTDVDGDVATSSSFVLVTRTMPDNSTVVSLTGEYQDELVKVDGHWRFTSRSVLTDVVGEQGPRPDYRETAPELSVSVRRASPVDCGRVGTFEAASIGEARLTP